MLYTISVVPSPSPAVLCQWFLGQVREKRR